VQTLHAHLEGKRHVIWDFNGTLLDDVALCVDVIAGILTEHGLAPIDEAAYLAKFRFPIVEYYRDLGFDFERTPFDGLTRQFIERYMARVGEAPLFDGTEAALAALRQRGVGCSMLSASHEQDLLALLGRLGIRSYFDHVCGLGDHYAASKIERGKQLLQTLALPPEDLVLIGDTHHDLEVAHALGIDAVLVTGGHSTFERLAAKHHQVVRRI
jgi:phosphoglycolate phosphatase